MIDADGHLGLQVRDPVFVAEFRDLRRIFRSFARSTESRAG
jgi:hypothetical protein